MFEKIDLDKFVAAMTPERIAGYAGDRPSFREIARAICERYGVLQKNIVSIGGGNCYEEVALIKEGGNNCYVVDIDEHGDLAGIIDECRADAGNSIRLNFIIDDFTTMDLASMGLEKFDVIYVSGFTPDEVRRGEIRDKAVKRFSMLKRMLPFIRREFCQWPLLYTKPLHESLEVLLKKQLKNEGLFILQSYGFGVDISVSPEFIKHMIKQLENIGLSLVEGYQFKESPAISFWVAIKGDREFARKFARKIAGKDKISRFHARSEVDNSCLMFYSAI